MLLAGAKGALVAGSKKQASYPAEGWLGLAPGVQPAEDRL